MEVPLHLHPFELSRQFSLFFWNFVLDFDLRFPEGRRRRTLELAFELPDQTLPKDWHLEEFQNIKTTISILDWAVLFEWNERWQQIRIRILVHQALTDSTFREASSTSALIRVALQRLKEIELAIRLKPLSMTPTLFQLFRFRWRFSGLRDEAEYLIARLKKITTSSY
ncbi:MAG: hypothetical protein JWQ35_668 [Bacteriovoracaceae bacterium]|nr:hypothetical protein [Bacteriovoracaceae bacterium]